MAQMLCEDAQQLAGTPHNRGGGRVGHRWGNDLALAKPAPAALEATHILLTVRLPCSRSPGHHVRREPAARCFAY